MPTLAEKEQHHEKVLFALAETLRGLGWEITPHVTHSGLWAITDDGWGYYLDLRGLAITDLVCRRCNAPWPCPAHPSSVGVQGPVMCTVCHQLVPCPHNPATP